MAQPAVRSIGPRRAGRGHPSTPARTPEVSFPRASSLDHSPPTSGRWIRRPPHRRDGKSLTRAPARMACDAVFFERRAKSEGWRRGLCWQSADCQRSVKGCGRLRSAGVHHNEHNGFTKDTTGPEHDRAVCASVRGRLSALRPEERCPAGPGSQGDETGGLSLCPL